MSLFQPVAQEAKCSECLQLIYIVDYGVTNIPLGNNL